MAAILFRSPRPGWIVSAVFLHFVFLGCGNQGDRASDRPASGGSVEVAEAWLDAVREGDEARAILKATRLVPPGAVPLPDRYFAPMAAREGIGPGFFQGSFDHWDFQLWRHAYLFHSIASELMADVGDIPTLFSAVTDRVEGVEPRWTEPPWPWVVWEGRAGVCDRQTWLLLEMAYQVGWDGAVVYLYDPDTGVSPHTVGELRRGDGVVYVDPLKGVILPEMTVHQVASDAQLLRELWPGEEEIQEAYQKMELWIPSYAQDYRPRNQLLQTHLVNTLGARAPRFGEAPSARLDRYRRYPEARGIGNRLQPLDLWFYPFRVLAAHVRMLDAPALVRWRGG